MERRGHSGPYHLSVVRMYISAQEFPVAKYNFYSLSVAEIGLRKDVSASKENISFYEPCNVTELLRF